MDTSTATLTINEYEVSVTNGLKKLWPDVPLTKMDYLTYLSNIHPYLLPHLYNRTLTVVRFPDGIHGQSFYQKNCPTSAPNFIQTRLVNEIEYIVCNDLAALMWLGNQAAIELHIPFHRQDERFPNEIVFDLDPAHVNKFNEAVYAAQLIHELLDALLLPNYVKTSGNKGLQVYVPLPKQTVTYEHAKKLARFIALFLVEREPRLFTIERFKRKRGNKLYVDYMQFHVGKTIIAPYSARGNAHATIATPLRWKEVDDALDPTQFTMTNVVERINTNGCPFENMAVVDADHLQLILEEINV